jgi:putative endonuclease
MPSKQGYVYIIPNKQNGTLYVRAISDLIKRVFERRNHLADGFASKYKLNDLVYYEIFDDITAAILREKQIKKWNRDLKQKLINKFNHEWKNLYDDILK